MKILAVLVLSFLPGLALALGFGEVRLYSFLNEPLDAEIELLDAASFQTEHILVSLGLAQEFKQAGLARPDSLAQLEFKISREASRTFVRMTTSEPIRQASLEFLVNLTWPSGYIVQGYTILLDPLPTDIASIQDRRSSPLKNYTRSSTVLLPSQPLLNREQSNLPIPMTVVSNVSLPEISSIQSSEPMAEKPLDSVENNSPQTSEAPEASDKFFESMIKQRDQWLMIAMAVTGSALLVVLMLLFIRHKKMKLMSASLSASGLSSETFYNVVEPVEELDQSREPLLYEDEMTLKLKLARHYFNINDEDNAVSLLKDVQERGQSSEKEQAENLLNEIYSKNH